MPRKIAILLLVVFIGGLLFPFLTLASQYESNKGVVIYKGLVPCGKTKASEGESSLVTEPCQLCHLFVMIDGIIDFVTQKIVPPIVALMIIIAGIMFFFAGGNPALLLQAKKLITSVVIGLVIMFSAFLIIQTILNVMQVADTNPLYSWLKGDSFIIYCPIEYEEDGVVSDDDDEEEWDDEEEVTGQSPLCEVEYTLDCDEGQKAEDGKCEPGEHTKEDPISEKTDDGKGWYCKFTAEFKPTVGGYLECYVPTGTIYANCIDDPDYISPEEGEWISENTDTSADNIKVLDLSCPDGTELEEGKCEPDGNTHVNPDGGEAYGDNGWSCKFVGDRDNPAKGEISIYCVPETTAKAILSTTPIVITDKSVSTEVDSVPSSQTIVGDDVYLVVPQEDTKAPANITLAYTDEWVTNAGLAENTLAIYHYDEVLSRWVGLPSTVNTANNTVTATTKHFSVFAIMGRKATATNCECTSGPCCDGCHYYANLQWCDWEKEKNYSCHKGALGFSVYLSERIKFKYCSGNSSKCNGKWKYEGDWSEPVLDHDCREFEDCKDGKCQPSGIQLIECMSGPCCNTETWKFEDTNKKCYTEPDKPEVACHWGTDCGDDLGIRARKRDRYCSGDSEICDGQWTEWSLWSNWEVYKSCSDTEVCSGDSCVYSLACDPNNDCECTHGDCCKDNCYYADNNELCDFKIDKQYGCPWGTGCGDDLGLKTRFRYHYCSGQDAECSGSWKEEPWPPDWKRIGCSPSQVCNASNKSCEYSKNCGCECSEGDDCCKDGCHYDGDGVECLRDENTSLCINCQWEEDTCAKTANGYEVFKIKTCNNGKCSNVGISDVNEYYTCLCRRNTGGLICDKSTICEHSPGGCPNCPNNYCEHKTITICHYGECESPEYGIWGGSDSWGKCCTPDTPKECVPGTTCCTNEGYYEEYGKICQDYNWGGCTGGEYTSECDNMKIGSQTKKTMACNDTGSCNVSSWETYRNCAIMRNTAGFPCDEGAGYCENGKCVHYSNMVCTPGTSCCDSDGQYKPKGTQCYTDPSWGTCITDWDTSSDCQESITGTKYKNHKVCDAFGSCSVNNKETTSCTDTRNTDGDGCGSGKHCKDGKCLTDEPIYGGECGPYSTCCTSRGYYRPYGTRCYTDSTWSSCKSCDYRGSCDEKADGEKTKTHKTCNSSGSCSVVEKEKKDCTCTRNTNGKKCSSSSKNCYCSSGRCYCPGGH